MTLITRITISLALFAGIIGGAETAVAKDDFYEGRKVTYIVPAGAGGGYGLYGQIIAQHLAKHIPGNPTVVPQYMPGAGGNVAANYLYNAAPKDGSVIAGLFSTLTVTQALQPTVAKFDATKFSWIGSVAPMINTLGVWANGSTPTIDDAKSKEIVMGATGKSSELYIYPKIMNELLGTKFKIVLGYDGSGAILLAMERDEVDGMAMALAVWEATRPEWIKEKKVVYLAQTGLKPDKSIPDVPTLVQLARTPDDKKIMSFLSAPAALGRIVAAPPGIPSVRLAILRKAFDETMADPDFVKDITSRKLIVEPTSGKELDDYVQELLSTPKPLIDRAKTLLGF